MSSRPPSRSTCTPRCCVNKKSDRATGVYCTERQTDGSDNLVKNGYRQKARHWKRNSTVVHWRHCGCHVWVLARPEDASVTWHPNYLKTVSKDWPNMAAETLQIKKKKKGTHDIISHKIYSFHDWSFERFGLRSLSSVWICGFPILLSDKIVSKCSVPSHILFIRYTSRKVSCVLYTQIFLLSMTS